jgi:hypothetical protein
MIPTTAESLTLRVGTIRYADTGSLAVGACADCGAISANLSKVKEVQLKHVYGAPSFKAVPAWAPKRIFNLCGRCTAEAVSYAD